MTMNATNTALPEFSGIYLTPETHVGTNFAGINAFLAHLRQLTRPSSAEGHLLIREWGMIQWRLQQLAQMELDWWAAYDQAMDEATETDAPGEVLLQCNRAIAAYEKLVRLEARFKKREGQLLPLMTDLLKEPNATVRESEGRVPQNVSLKLNVGQHTNAVSSKMPNSTPEQYSNQGYQTVPMSHQASFDNNIDSSAQAIGKEKRSEDCRPQTPYVNG